MKYPEFRQLHTSRLLLRRLSMDDLPQYYAHIGGSSAVPQHMLWEPHQDISQSASSIEKVLRRYQEGKCYRWAIARKADGRLIGVIELLRFQETDNSCSFAYMLAEDAWNQGFATEALLTVLGFAFSEMDISAVICDHFIENPASGRVMQKAGMTCRRIVPRKYEKQGVFHDAVEYILTKEDWIKKHGT